MAHAGQEGLPGLRRGLPCPDLPFRGLLPGQFVPQALFQDLGGGEVAQGRHQAQFGFGKGEPPSGGIEVQDAQDLAIVLKGHGHHGRGAGFADAAGAFGTPGVAEEHGHSAVEGGLQGGLGEFGEILHRPLPGEHFQGQEGSAFVRAAAGLDPDTARELAISALAALEGAFVLGRAARSTRPVEVAGEMVAAAVETALAARRV